MRTAALVIFGIVMFAIISFGLLAPIALAIYAAFRWRGKWRLLALVPLAGDILFFAPMVRHWMKDPTADNLWGVIFMPLSLIWLVYIAVLLSAKKKRDQAALLG